VLNLSGIMKKVMMVLVASIFLMSFVVAQVGPGDGTGAEHDAIVASGGQEGNPVAGEGIGARVVAGNYRGANGQQMMIQEKANSRVRLEVGGVGVDCDCNMTQERVNNRTMLKTKLSNGRNAEIKVMPDVASETALQRLRLRACDGDCEIELREVGKGDGARLAYEVRMHRQSKFLGLFSMGMDVEAQVDAESGEVIGVKKPWWAFLASEPAE